eukprot:7251426-Pyramimonas_sp.AAC.1
MLLVGDAVIRAQCAERQVIVAMVKVRRRVCEQFQRAGLDKTAASGSTACIAHQAAEGLRRTDIPATCTSETVEHYGLGTPTS